jgi:hypothetical protein
MIVAVATGFPSMIQRPESGTIAAVRFAASSRLASHFAEATWPKAVSISSTLEDGQPLLSVRSLALRRGIAASALSECVQRAPLLAEEDGTDVEVCHTLGVPTFASSGLFSKPSEMFAHGLNERLSVTHFYQGLDHIYQLAVELGGARRGH